MEISGKFEKAQRATMHIRMGSRQPRITAFQRDLCSYIPCVGALSMILRMAFVSFRLGIIHCYTGNKPAAFILECFLSTSRHGPSLTAVCFQNIRMDA